MSVRETGADQSQISVDAVRLGLSPRDEPQDVSHAALLAAAATPLPPVVVHEPTMTIIDGTHRYLAARLRGDQELAVRFFEGSADDAYIESVRANVTHGKPLTRAERERAAIQVLTIRPEWSDRLVAIACGVSPKTVAALRRRAQSSPTATRIGRDGKRRPVDSTSARLRAAELIRESPDQSLRSVARTSGTSLTTVRDVKKRLSEGRSPLPNGRRAGPEPSHPWTADSACRSTTDGQAFAAWFESVRTTDADWLPFVAGIPLSRLYEAASEARARSESWLRFASALEQRATQTERARRYGDS